MRKALEKLAPNSKLDILWKFLLFCVLIMIWNVVWNWHISGQQDRKLSTLLLDSFAVGGPFAAIFTFGSWYQVTAIQALSTRARIDELSGLLNRREFLRRVNEAVASSQTGMILLMDADHFKGINDVYGHATGDRCITAIGHRLMWHLREIDIAGRVGGEEFAVYLPDVTKAHGRVVAERLGQPVSFTDVEQTKHLSVTMSVGAVWFSREHNVEKQLMLADEALYQAKTSGRARLVIRGDDQTTSLDLRKAKNRNRRRTSSKVQAA